MSLIVGAINDINISTAVEACNMSDLNVLGAYLKNRIYLMKEPDRTMQASNLAGTSRQNRSIFLQGSQKRRLQNVVCAEKKVMIVRFVDIIR